MQHFFQKLLCLSVLEHFWYLGHFCIFERKKIRWVWASGGGGRWMKIGTNGQFVCYLQHEFIHCFNNFSILKIMELVPLYWDHLLISRIQSMATFMVFETVSRIQSMASMVFDIQKDMLSYAVAFQSNKWRVKILSGWKPEVRENRFVQNWKQPEVWAEQIQKTQKSAPNCSSSYFLDHPKALKTFLAPPPPQKKKKASKVSVLRPHPDLRLRLITFRTAAGAAGLFFNRSDISEILVGHNFTSIIIYASDIIQKESLLMFLWKSFDDYFKIYCKNVLRHLFRRKKIVL